MQSMRKGMQGLLVARLQNKLADLGFYQAKIDADFGSFTDQAVRAFQQAHSLVVDGVVGRRTLALMGLNLSDSEAPAQSWSVPFVQRICHDSPSSNIAYHWPIILAAMQAESLGDDDMLLMAVATIYVETGRFAPLDEYVSIYNTTGNGHPFDKYDDRQDLGNQGYPDGARYKGRGYIQLTGRANYRHIGERIGLGDELERDPEMANDPAVAAKILASFLKRCEQRVRQAIEKQDLKQARRAVNGGTHGLPEFTRCFLLGKSCLKDDE